tara:strand:- start:7592 stop:8032 length:441 start_codon:yes stop_codon:yes gene_type:complete
MAFRDWFIFNRFRKQHGNRGHDAVREIFSNERFTDRDILAKYPSLSNSDIAIIRLIYRVEKLENELNKTVTPENTQPKSSNENHRGLFKVVDEHGEYIQYNKGDIVRYDNKTYIANRKIELGMGPLHEDSGWKEITADTIEGGEFN